MARAAPVTAWPPGLGYRPAVVSEDEERALIEAIERLAFEEVRMRGQVARRRTAHFGWRYGYESWTIEPGPPVPDVFLDLRRRAGALAGVAPERLAEVLVTEYRPGAGIGWHRDAPMFGEVVGVSLGSACRFRFRRGAGADRQTFELPLEPRSAYVLGGAVRWQWQHSIPPARALRYSVTFRTVREPGRRRVPAGVG